MEERILKRLLPFLEKWNEIEHLKESKVKRRKAGKAIAGDTQHGKENGRFAAYVGERKEHKNRR